jgi:glycosyltransferase involved in cell wall biosynthesis
MQKFYSQPNDIWCPYAHDSTVHYPDPLYPADTDACLVGLHYENRNEWIRQLRARGHSVIYELGPIFDEYRQLNCRARLGLNWSSLNDVCARVFEIMGFERTPIINRVPDLEALGFKENVHYYGFSTMDEAIQKVEIALNNPEEAINIAQNARAKVAKDDTWDIRAEQILKECGLL